MLPKALFTLEYPTGFVTVVRCENPVQYGAGGDKYEIKAIVKGFPDEWLPWPCRLALAWVDYGSMSS